MTDLLTKNFTRVVAWVVSAAVAIAFAIPQAAAFEQLPRSMIYEFVSQSGTVQGGAHVVEADAGDTVSLSLTVRNRSQNPAGRVWYGTSDLAEETGRPNAHAIGVGTTNPRDNNPDWLDDSSFEGNNGNRFTYYDGEPVHPGDTITLNWDVEVANDADDGTYRLDTGLVREWDEWGRQMKDGQILSQPDIFWEFEIGDGGDDGTTVEGDLEVSAGSMPAGDTVAPGAANHKVAEWEFENNGNDDMEIQSLKVRRRGVGDTDDIANAYIYQGDQRLTSGKTFNSSSNLATFGSINATVPENEEIELSLHVDWSGSASSSSLDSDTAPNNNADSNNQHRFVLESASDVSLADVGGTFPIGSNTFTVGGSEVGEITIDDYSGTPSNPTVGDQDALINDFSLSASNEDAMVHRVTLFHGGSISASDIENFELTEVSSQDVVATADGVNDEDYVVLNFDSPYEIEDGDTRNFELRADLTGRADDTIDFYLDAYTDVYAVGDTFGFGMQVTDNDTSTDNYGSGADQTTLQGGTLTISHLGPSAQDISNADDDVTAWRGNFTAETDLEIRNWRVRITDGTDDSTNLTDSSGNPYVDDIKIWDLTNNTVIAGPQSIDDGTLDQANDATQSDLTFSDDFTLDASETVEIGISYDITNDPDTSSATLDITTSLTDGTNTFSSNDIRELSSNNFLDNTADIAPSGGVTGNALTVQSPSLTINTAPSPTDNTTIIGTDDYNGTSFSFVAGSGSDIEVTSIKVSADLDQNSDNDYGNSSGREGSETHSQLNSLVSSLKLMVDGQQIGQTKSLQSASGDNASEATFNNLSGFTVPASSNKRVKVVADFNSGYNFASGTSDDVRFAIMQNDVSAIDSEGNSVSESYENSSAEAGANTDDSDDDDGGEVEVTVNNTGSLSVSEAGDSPTGTVHVAGSNNVEVAKFLFEASRESFNVQEVGLINSAGNNDRLADVSVTYPTEGGGTNSIGASNTTGNQWNVDFPSNQPMFVEAGEQATLTVEVDLADFSLLDGTEAESVDFDLDANNTNSENRAVGVASGTTSNNWGSDITSTDSHEVFRTGLSVSTGDSVEPHARGSSDTVAQFNLSADAASSAYFRGAVKAADGSAASWATAGMTITADTGSGGQQVSGSDAIKATEDGSSSAGDNFSYDLGTSTDFSNFSKMSFWIRSDSAKSAGDIEVHLSSDQDTTDNQDTDGDITKDLGDQSVGALTANTWSRQEIDLSSLDSSTQYVTFEIAQNPDDSGNIWVDELKFYNNSWTLDLSGGASTLADDMNAVQVDLDDQSGTTKAVGWVNDSDPSNDDSTESVTLIPGSDGDVDSTTDNTTSDSMTVSASGSQTYDVVTNTSSLLDADNGNAQTFTVSTDTGQVGTAGDFRWYDGSEFNDSAQHNAGFLSLGGIDSGNLQVNDNVAYLTTPVSSTLSYSSTY